MEIQLREFDRCRTLYQKFLEVRPELQMKSRPLAHTSSLRQYDPSLGQAWIQWTTLEAELGDLERARAIYELAVQQSLDMPEVVWKVRRILGGRGVIRFNTFLLTGVHRL